MEGHHALRVEDRGHLVAQRAAVAVAAGFIFGHELTLSFGALEMAVLIAAAILAAFIATNGNATWLEGAELIAIYVIAALAFWYV